MGEIINAVPCYLMHDANQAPLETPQFGFLHFEDDLPVFEFVGSGGRVSKMWLTEWQLRFLQRVSPHGDTEL